MKTIAAWVADYFRQINLQYFLFTSLILSAAIGANYHYHLNHFILTRTVFWERLTGFYYLFLLFFTVAWYTSFWFDRQDLPRQKTFYLLLLLAPLLFALKVSFRIEDLWPLNDPTTNTILQWPIKAIPVLIGVILLWRIGGNAKTVAGLSRRRFNPRPYLFLLLLALPLVLWAGTRESFRQVYPKLQMIGQPQFNLKSILFELSYGLDFFTIELFFRGFLVLAFIKYGGTKAILPMAVFYCTIHFGKPMAECISSYFGGLILGAVVINTRSIWGGLIVHLGMAWMMELVGLFNR